MRDAAFRFPVERGAIPLWMPRFYAAKEIEDQHFGKPMVKAGRDFLLRQRGDG